MTPSRASIEAKYHIYFELGDSGYVPTGVRILSRNGVLGLSMSKIY
jgi:hypothetical protein